MRKEAKTLLLFAVKEYGLDDVDNTFSHIEESLTDKEGKEILGFLKWVKADKKNRAFGHGNVDERFLEYKRSCK